MMGAINLSLQGLVDTVVWLIVLAVVGGILIYLVQKAPKIPPDWKEFIIYFIYFVAALFVINILLSFIGYPVVRLR